jgi:hypothetical protein
VIPWNAAGWRNRTYRAPKPRKMMGPVGESQDCSKLAPAWDLLSIQQALLPAPEPVTLSSFPSNLLPCCGGLRNPFCEDEGHAQACPKMGIQQALLPAPEPVTLSSFPSNLLPCCGGLRNPFCEDEGHAQACPKMGMNAISGLNAVAETLAGRLGFWDALRRRGW